MSQSNYESESSKASEMGNEIRQKAKEVGKKAKAESEDFLERASQFASDTTEAIKEKASQAMDYTRDGYDTVINTIKENPKTSVAVAALVGGIIGMCCHKKEE